MILEYMIGKLEGARSHWNSVVRIMDLYMLGDVKIILNVVKVLIKKTG
jgi:hypothetical protein